MTKYGLIAPLLSTGQAGRSATSSRDLRVGMLNEPEILYLGSHSAVPWHHAAEGSPPSPTDGTVYRLFRGVFWQDGMLGHRSDHG